MIVQGVIFDLGGTLLRFYPPDDGWEGMEKAGGSALISLLTKLGHRLPDEALEIIWKHMQSYWISIGQNPDPETLRLSYQLRNLLVDQWQLPLLEEELLVAEHAYTAGSQVYVRPMAGALETVRLLKERGFPIGVISNTTWTGIAHQYDLMQFGMWPYFDFALFSSDERAWKPFAPIFERAVARMNLRPDEVVYIGDSLFFDVYGAQQAGLKTIWIEQPSKWWPPHLEVDDIIADVTVKNIMDVVSIVQKGDFYGETTN